MELFWLMFWISRTFFLNTLNGLDIWIIDEYWRQSWLNIVVMYQTQWRQGTFIQCINHDYNQKLIIQSPLSYLFSSQPFLYWNVSVRALRVITSSCSQSQIFITKKCSQNIWNRKSKWLYPKESHHWNKGLIFAEYLSKI